MKVKQRNIYVGLSLVILGCVIGIIILTIMSLSAKQEQDDLEAAIKDAKKELAQAQSVNLEEMEQELAEIEGQLDEIEVNFPSNLDSTDVMEIVLGYADKHHVKILPIRMSPTGETVVQGKKYYLVSFDATIQGTFSNLLGFISELEDGEYETITIGDTRISGKGSSWTANLSVNVYSQKVDEIPSEEG